MAKGINKVCQRYNGNVIFQVKPTPGDAVVLRTSRGIYHRTYPEGYFMQKSPLAKDYVAPDKTNSVLKVFKRMYAEMKAVIDVMRTEATEANKDAVQNVK